MVPSVRVELVISDILVWCSAFWAKFTFADNSETLSSLYGHALLILTKSSKSKNHVVHEQRQSSPHILNILLLTFCLT